MPAGGTFFVFSDYMRGAVRLAALSRYKSLFVWTHDSVGLGEDGPTHQPIEQLAAMRAMPGLRVIRPADANEVSQAWRVHVDGEGPTALILTRQKLPVLGATAERAPEGVPRAPTRWSTKRATGSTSCSSAPGSEVSLCVDALDLARRALGAGRVDAVLGAVRRAVRRLPRAGAARRRPDARRRSGRHLRLGALRRRRRSASITSARRRPGRSR